MLQLKTCFDPHVGLGQAFYDVHTINRINFVILRETIKLLN